MLPVQYSCCHAMCLRLEPLESNSFNLHDVIEVLCVVASLASVKCSGGWERDWGYCLGAVGWDAVILSFCFLLFDGDGEKWETDYGGFRVTGGTQGFDEVIKNGYALQKLQGGRDISVSLCTGLHSLWINCKLEADAIKSYELLIAMWCITQTAKLLFCTLCQRRSFETLILNASSFSFLLVIKFLWNLY